MKCVKPPGVELLPVLLCCRMSLCTAHLLRHVVPSLSVRLCMGRLRPSHTGDSPANSSCQLPTNSYLSRPSRFARQCCMRTKCQMTELGRLSWRKSVSIPMRPILGLECSIASTVFLPTVVRFLGLKAWRCRALWSECPQHPVDISSRTPARSVKLFVEADSVQTAVASTPIRFILCTSTMSIT